MDNAKAELQQRLMEPVKKLIAKLNTAIGDPGCVFRDTAVTNIKDAITQARELAMGDTAVLDACAELETATSHMVANPDALRQSQDIRTSAADKLREVQKKMSFMFGGETL